MINLRNVTLSYKDITPIKDMSLVLFENDGITELRGASGSGKSTLLNAIVGLMKPTTGEITTAGHKFSMVFQENRLIETLSAYENLLLITNAIASNAVASDAITQALRVTELFDARNKPCAEFSGGMKRRVAIARAYLYAVINPSVNTLVLDEPFDGLDAELKTKLGKALRARFDYILLAAHGNDVDYFLRQGERPARVLIGAGE